MTIIANMVPSRKSVSHDLFQYLHGSSDSLKRSCSTVYLIMVCLLELECKFCESGDETIFCRLPKQCWALSRHSKTKKHLKGCVIWIKKAWPLSTCFLFLLGYASLGSASPGVLWMRSEMAKVSLPGERTRCPPEGEVSAAGTSPLCRRPAEPERTSWLDPLPRAWDP